MDSCVGGVWILCALTCCYGVPVVRVVTLYLSALEWA